MPRPKMLPTPVSSTEIKGHDGAHQLSALQLSFELPPLKIVDEDSSSLRPAGSKTTTPEAIFPVQPAEAVKSRRRASSTAYKKQFALPPPPTRSRTIIQMKPHTQEDPSDAVFPAKTASAPSKAASSGSKKKQSSSNSATRRKIARRTAHSLIERRRRSKINDEFAILKDLIPACTGEMHKLAILQASIDYVRYLEDCVSQLKSQCTSHSFTPTPAEFIPPPLARREAYGHDEHYGDEDGSDVEMIGSEEGPSPTITQPPVSPSLLPEALRHRHDSSSSASTDQRRYSYIPSPTAFSPVFDPQTCVQARGSPLGSNSTLASPVLAPLRELDQEATAALLMLNTDRRGVARTGGPTRGMSVRDLLST
ncbi:uncharacterized protein BCR38DRAFT_458699 [Pseudomassariella vexata]|uniref:BHLH domain-containing protein n=1 Tax=Pseudomassariella vexata TaxID=1141098 RepID=A0A1Y2DSH5_9PEZI|nr:uncharacterized protein BCR38DRAFT_458699 [Pseudomassariella vexata]ORY62099.1 hypothetical protein BCR38DRAFT_458699 [Pseudomassariella vexata]